MMFDLLSELSIDDFAVLGLIAAIALVGLYVIGNDAP